MVHLPACLVVAAYEHVAEPVQEHMVERVVHSPRPRDLRRLRLLLDRALVIYALPAVEQPIAQVRQLPVVAVALFDDELDQALDLLHRHGIAERTVVAVLLELLADRPGDADVKSLELLIGAFLAARAVDANERFERVQLKATRADAAPGEIRAIIRGAIDDGHGPVA